MRLTASLDLVNVTERALCWVHGTLLMGAPQSPSPSPSPSVSASTVNIANAAGDGCVDCKETNKAVVEQTDGRDNEIFLVKLSTPLFLRI